MNIGEKQNTPLVSVIMPAYNSASFVEEAIRSVMMQTMENWELIVIDDCSTDATFSIIDSLAHTDNRIRLLCNEQNSGVAMTRNRGLDLARGKFVSFIDSDDAWYPEKLERQIRLLKSAGADFCYCSYEIVGFSGKKVRPDYLVPKQIELENILGENVLLCSSLLVSAKALKTVRFTTEFYHEDYVLELDLLKNGYRAVGCSEVLVRWRYIENSRSFNKWKSAKNRWRIYRDYLKLPTCKCVYLFIQYACGGLRKYFVGYEQRGGKR